MPRVLIRKIHKWVAAGTSAILLAWLVSGIVMAVPIEWLARWAGQGPAANPAAQTAGGHAADYSMIAVSIPEAIAALESSLGRRADVRAIRVTWFQDRPAYEFALGDGNLRLVDGVTGTPLLMTEALAKQMAQMAVPSGRIEETERLERRDFYYWGSLPAYKVSFADPSGYVIYVSDTGALSRSTALSRLHRWVTSVHGFEPLNLIYDSNKLRVGALLAFSGLSLLVIASGLYLVLPSRRRPRRAAAQTTGFP